MHSTLQRTIDKAVVLSEGKSTLTTTFSFSLSSVWQVWGEAGLLWQLLPKSLAHIRSLEQHNLDGGSRQWCVAQLGSWGYGSFGIWGGHRTRRISRLWRRFPRRASATSWKWNKVWPRDQANYRQSILPALVASSHASNVLFLLTSGPQLGYQDKQGEAPWPVEHSLLQLSSCIEWGRYSIILMLLLFANDDFESSILYDSVLQEEPWQALSQE